MPKKAGRNTKARIVASAWKLFYEQGYDNTTVEDIIFDSETSKGSFYHYFSGKDDLLGSLSMIFDEKYEELRDVLPESMTAAQKLTTLTHELFTMIDNSVSIELLARLLSQQLVTHGEKHLLDRSRTYFKMLSQIIRTGQEHGELRDDMTVNEVVKAYAMYERALMYDWCLSGGEYALSKYADQMVPIFLAGFAPQKDDKIESPLQKYFSSVKVKD